MNRQGIATLLRAGDEWLLFDTGRATLQRLYECGIPAAKVHRIFYTHLHSDHICGLGDLWMTGWFVLHRSAPLMVHGPEGTARFIRGLQEVHHFDLAVRPRYETAAKDGRDILVEEFREGVVYESGELRVSAFLVDHGPVKPAYGFRIDWHGHSVVLSGDTTYCPNLVHHAANCDLLIHEIAAGSRQQLAANEITRRVLSIHTDPDQMARICEETRPRLTVLNHVSLWRVTQFDLLARVRAGTRQPVELGEDRMEILVGSEIRVFPPGPPKLAEDMIVSDPQHRKESST